MSEQFIEPSEFAHPLPARDSFGGRSSCDAALEAVRRHCRESDMATAAISYLNGLSLASVASMMDTTEGHAYELIIAAEQLLLQLRSKRQGRQVIRVAQQSQRTVEQQVVHVSEESEKWRERAVCASEDPDLFFPTSRSREKRQQEEESAKAVCARCDVQAACLEWALEHGQDSGVWGGMSEDERRQLKRSKG